MALIIYRPLFWVVLVAMIMALTWLARQKRLHWWPAWLIRTSLAALMLLVIFFPNGYSEVKTELPARQVMVVDQSTSLSGNERARLKQAAVAWQSGATERLVVEYGAQALVVPDPAKSWPTVDGQTGGLLSALQKAEQILAPSPAGSSPSGTIILATSGVDPQPVQVETAITSLAAKGYNVDILPANRSSDPTSGWVGPVNLPGHLWEKQPITVNLAIGSPPTNPLEDLEITLNGKVSQLSHELKNGMVVLPIPGQMSGILTLAVKATFGGQSPDGQPGKVIIEKYASAQVFPSPRILFVTSSPDNDKDFTAMLAQNSVTVDAITPDKLPTGLDQLSKYQMIILNSFPADDLSIEQMLTLKLFVSQKAGGLITLGGMTSYLLGNYNNTLLEPMLPIKLKTPPRKLRSAVMILLAIDTSYSMDNHDTNAPSALQLAIEAALRTIDTLQPEDYLGVLTYSNDPQWIIDISPVGDGQLRRQAVTLLNQVVTNGGTNMYKAMQAIQDKLANMPVGAPTNRNMLLLTDGMSSDGTPELFNRFASTVFTQYNMTVSTIAEGIDADQQIMKGIANAGKGRFYYVPTASDLPNIIVQESRAGRGETLQLGETSLAPGEIDHPILNGLDIGDLPQLSGYNALTSKRDQGAEDVLISRTYQDPILSVWQYGLGKVVSWMGDSGQAWNSHWPDRTKESTFWSQVIRYALPNPALGPAQAEVSVGATDLTLTADLTDNTSFPVNLANTAFTYTQADSTYPASSIQAGEQQVNLSEIEPGIYQAVTQRPPNGAYRGVLSYSYPDRFGGTVSGQLTVPFAVNAASEAVTSNQTLQDRLAAWAKAGNGQLLAPLNIPAAPPATPISPASDLKSSWLAQLILASIIFWLVDIALRRRWLPWR